MYNGTCIIPMRRHGHEVACIVPAIRFAFRGHDLAVHHAIVHTERHAKHPFRLDLASWVMTHVETGFLVASHTPWLEGKGVEALTTAAQAIELGLARLEANFEKLPGVIQRVYEDKANFLVSGVNPARTVNLTRFRA